MKRQDITERLERARDAYGKTPDIIKNGPRATDSDRDKALEYLARGLEQGALSQEEFNLRSGLVLGAVGKVYVDELCSDLPVSCTAKLPAKKQRQPRQAGSVSKRRDAIVMALITLASLVPWLIAGSIGGFTPAQGSAAADWDGATLGIGIIIAFCVMALYAGNAAKRRQQNRSYHH